MSTLRDPDACRQSTSFSLKLFKSAGVPVTAAVHRLLTQANGARDRRDWSQAAAGYEEALKRDPDLAHIWIQLGHAFKESESLAAAEAAYRRSADLQPNSADPHVHIGHLMKRRGDTAAAGRSYITALKLDPRNADAVGELHRLVGRSSEIRSQDILAIVAPNTQDISTTTFNDPISVAQASLTDLTYALRHRSSDVNPEAVRKIEAAMALLGEIDAEVQPDPEETTPIVFDVSDLIAYFQDARVPTGIQRVQIEVITNASVDRGAAIRICCFMQERDEWLEIPPDVFVTLCGLSLASGDRGASEWLTALVRLNVILGTAQGFIFPPDAVLINLGTSWWIPNYFLSVRRAKSANETGLRYVPFVHDFIPLLAAHCCAKALTQDFIGWVIGVFEHADHFLANSDATKRDLLHVAALLGYDIAPDSVKVIRLDGDPRKSLAPIANKAALKTWGLDRQTFVLFVSTIEVRKNHVLAFNAWSTLIRKYGVKNVPKLICVGKRGWLDDAIFATLQAHDDLRDRVLILSGISDGELADLYRGCLFTLYPSTYEGWGLPVTESLCYGKVPLVSNGSSLPEAGGPFAVYFEAGSVNDLTKSLDKMIYQADYRLTYESKILSEFKPRSWRQIADEIIASVADYPTLSQQPDRSALIAAAELGAYHPLARNIAMRIWPGMRSAEVFRTGPGWWGQDDFGCWTKPQGGELQIGFTSAHETLRLHLHLRGLPSRSTSFQIEVDDDLIISGVVGANEFKWFGLNIPPQNDVCPHHRIILRGETPVDLAEHTGGQDRREVSVGLAGFFICAANDAAARMAFLEAVTLDNLADITFSRSGVNEYHAKLEQFSRTSSNTTNVA